MILQIKPYLYIFWLRVKETVQYKFNYFATLMYALISTIIYAFLGFALFSGSERVDPKYFLCYYGLIALVAEAISPAQYVAHKMMTDILSGEIAVHLVRPYHYLGTLYAGYLGECIPKVMFHMLFVSGVQIYLLGEVSLLTLILGGIACIQGFSIFFLIQALIGCLTVWIKDITRIRDVIFSLLLLLGGRLIPVEYLLQSLQRIVAYTPIVHVYDTPMRIFLGNVSWLALLLQFVWVIVLGGACVLLFRFQVRKRIEMGG
ncbi:MAG: hypothetical protein HDQ99_02215 [Lachnospiraceae bacterium]|nr:hypothetical protein [Lachnospiraceae bacterium]